MAMEHSYIEEHSLIERYHGGRLPTEVEARFEEHFVDCAQCMEQLEAARGFERGLKAMVTEDLARARAVGMFAWWARRGRLARLGLAAMALLVAAALPSLWFRGESRQLRQVAEQARGASEDWRERYENEQRQASVLEQRLVDGESRWGEERRRLEERIEEALSAAGSGAAQGVARLAEPLINTPVFILSVLRGEGAEPSAIIDPGRVGTDLALAIDVDDDPRIESYRVTVNRVGGEQLWRRDGLVPNALEVLMVTFPVSFFEVGDYRLNAEGVTSAGDTVPVGSYLFRVTG